MYSFWVEIHKYVTETDSIWSSEHSNRITTTRELHSDCIFAQYRKLVINVVSSKFNLILIRQQKGWHISTLQNNSILFIGFFRNF